MPDRGFGFVQTEGVREDIFFHRSSVVESSFDELKEGDVVEFEMQHNPRAGRTCAVNLKPSTRSRNENRSENRAEVRSKPPLPPRPQRARGRIFTGWREEHDRMEQQAQLRRARAEGASADASRLARESTSANDAE